MNNINLLIANASGSLDSYLDMLRSAFKNASNHAVDDLSFNNVDVVAIDAPYSTIPELGVGGYTPSANLIYLSLNPAHRIQEKEIELSLLHEFHHAARWRDPGYGKNFEEALVTEGLACLYEQEKSGNIPIYAKANIEDALDDFDEATLKDSEYNHHELFITGNENLPRWFGYALGYKTVYGTSRKLDKRAGQLVDEPIESFQESLKALVHSNR